MTTFHAMNFHAVNIHAMSFYAMNFYATNFRLKDTRCACGGLDGDDTAIDGQVDATDEAAFVGGEEESC